LKKINQIKGLAILAVLLMHGGVSSGLLYEAVLVWAVPVFVVLMSYNQRNSFQRTSFNLKQYLNKKVDRLIIPFLITWVIAYATGTYLGLNLVLKPYVLPIDGPGNYFMPIILQFTIIFPALYYCFKARKKTTLATISIIYLAYLFLLPGLLSYFPGKKFMLFNANLIRFTPEIMLGLLLPPIKEIESKTTLVGLFFELLGKASYHIFLIQIILAGTGLSGIVFMASSILLGIIFYKTKK
jgi:fucose 4-O-acetylase-like acetyltransferase